MTTVIRVDSLSMCYRDAGKDLVIFSDLSFKVAQGESVAIVGASGIGKTTLLYVLGGLEQPSSGEVEICGVTYGSIRSKGGDISEWRGRNIGFVFQFHHLLPEFDALENVAMPLLVQGEAKSRAFDRARFLLDKMGLGARLNHRPGMLSGGEQQRVAIARAFAMSPRIILADEPTGNLDLNTANETINSLMSLRESEGTTLVIVTHSLDLASRLDRIFEMKSGVSGALVVYRN
ncbi:MAG TPA: ABC transporter ATP-binding protein [Oligoflexia bacterium]|nr:ABC transporter ATP-binding protein [Oligoflexia bacterium]HMP47071.1 ABC transporter ATP-binding protein [Oligoflexia bacterium]